MLPGVIAKMSHQIWFILIVRPPMNSSWKQKHVICRLWNQKNHLLWDHCWQKILEIDATMLNLLHLLCTCLTNPCNFYWPSELLTTRTLATATLSKQEKNVFAVWKNIPFFMSPWSNQNNQYYLSLPQQNQTKTTLILVFSLPAQPVHNVHHI